MILHAHEQTPSTAVGELSALRISVKSIQCWQVNTSQTMISDDQENCKLSKKRHHSSFQQCENSATSACSAYSTPTWRVQLQAWNMVQAYHPNQYRNVFMTAKLLLPLHTLQRHFKPQALELRSSICCGAVLQVEAQRRFDGPPTRNHRIGLERPRHCAESIVDLTELGKL